MSLFLSQPQCAMYNKTSESRDDEKGMEEAQTESAAKIEKSRLFFVFGRKEREWNAVKILTTYKTEQRPRGVGVSFSMNIESRLNFLKHVKVVIIRNRPACMQPTPRPKRAKQQRSCLACCSLLQQTHSSFVAQARNQSFLE